MQATTPAGVQTEVTVSAQTNEDRIAMLGPAASFFRDVHLITSTATQDGKTASVMCYVRRKNDGHLQVLGWVENW